MPAGNILPARSPEDPLFGLIYYVLGDSAITWISSVLYMQDPAGTVALNKEWYQIVNIPMSHSATKTTFLQMEVERQVVGSVIAKSGKSSNCRGAYLMYIRFVGAFNFLRPHSEIIATDVLITGASTFFLLKARKKALSRTRKLISNLIKICCQTTLPATTATLIELVCSRIGGKSLKLQASNSIILVLLDAVPIIYAYSESLVRNCMLYILNTRRSLQSGGVSTGLGNSDSNHPSGSRGHGQWRSNHHVELSSMGVNVHVRAKVDAGETSSGIEFDTKKSRSEMF
ncbi:hypothetical protein K438DRAFT_1776568 [Mycena galopus ATCC 62051]|nr:hypothetical protein K438DRAFT_1776568 [Mycena galopus ATCC 62051]